MSDITLVIVHPVSISREWLYGIDPGFPAGGEYLNPALVRRAIMTLVAASVEPFDDGFYHAEIHPFGMDDLLQSTSAAVAVEENFHKIQTKPDAKKKIFIHMGIRWEVSTTHKTCRVYGPKSDPANTITIDITAGGEWETK